MAGEVRQRKDTQKATQKATAKPAAAVVPTAKKAPKTYSGNLFRRGLAYLFEEDDASYLAVFRILWGSIMAYEAYTYMTSDFAKMYHSFYNCLLTFKYYGFEWCEVPENPLHLQVLIVLMCLSGLMLTAGFLYRASSIFFFLSFTYMYLLEQSMYLNHFYLVCVLSFMMILLPCNCYFSVDAYLWPRRYYSPTCPKWCLIFVKAELAVVYTYAGICKCNEDWLRGEPLRAWLSHRQNTPFIGWLLVRESTAYAMSYGGTLYDLTIAPLLLCRRTLPLGLMMTLFFHITNKVVFNIGIFPWMMIASTTFYLRPDWPRRVFHRLSRSQKPFEPIPTRTFAQTPPRSLKMAEYLVIVCFLVFMAHQVLVPIRLHAYPGTVGWNEYGHQFSWRMKLRTKKCDATAMAYSPDTHTAYLLQLERILNRRQVRKVPSRPDMIAQLAHFLGDRLDENAKQINPNMTSPHEVYIESWCELNARPYQQFTNGTHDIRSSPLWENPREWVTEVQPLSAEEVKNYPWNWDWNFNFFKGIDRLPKVDRKQMEERARIMKQNAEQKWTAFLKERDPEVQFVPLAAA